MFVECHRCKQCGKTWKSYDPNSTWGALVLILRLPSFTLHRYLTCSFSKCP
jgi:hypothetical protein